MGDGGEAAGQSEAALHAGNQGVAGVSMGRDPDLELKLRQGGLAWHLWISGLVHHNAGKALLLQDTILVQVKIHDQGVATAFYQRKFGHGIAAK